MRDEKKDEKRSEKKDEAGRERYGGETRREKIHPLVGRATRSRFIYKSASLGSLWISLLVSPTQAREFVLPTGSLSFLPFAFFLTSLSCICRASPSPPPPSPSLCLLRLLLFCVHRGVAPFRLGRFTPAKLPDPNARVGCSPIQGAAEFSIFNLRGFTKWSSFLLFFSFFS